MIVSDPYQLLGVARKASDHEVADAYAHLAEVFDPDRWISSPALRGEAKAWKAALDQAWEAIRSERALVVAQSRVA